jgi:SNF2 family DNA or RNA helicase
MAVKTYGNISIDTDGIIVIDRAEPHICIRLKQIFPKIGKTEVLPFNFKNNPENCHDLLWFLERYPLKLSDADRKSMMRGRKEFINKINEIESIFTPNYVPCSVQLREGKEARHYQLQGRDFYYMVNRFLLGDDLGLGKTITAIISLLDPTRLPAIVIAPSHMTSHWVEKITEFTDLKIHVIKQGKPYTLPPADVYISRYNFLYKWVDVFRLGTFKQAILDEVQDLRHSTTNKYEGAKVLSVSVEMLMALSATPIYNYGNEIFNIANIIKPGCLGTWYEFEREWIGADGKKVDNPKALGTYLREQNIMLRRTRKEVGKELPPVNKLIYTVEYDEEAVKNAEQQAIQLAIRTTTGTFMERGQAAFELDIFLRKLTGVSKAKYVAEFVRILLENGEPIVLAGWHRDVYDIWAKELAEYNPVFFTGTESPKQKDESKRKFLAGETNLFIMSLRSGVGLDGLQYRAKTVVYGELDYSPKVHDQLTGRVDRDRGEGVMEQTTAIYLISDGGSDPVIIDMLGLKASQSEGVMDPDAEIFEQVSDDSRIKKMAQRYLQMRNIKVETAV